MATSAPIAVEPAIETAPVVEQIVARPPVRRWPPAMRALTMVALGALAWVPIVAAGRYLIS